MMRTLAILLAVTMPIAASAQNVRTQSDVALGIDNDVGLLAQFATRLQGELQAEQEKMRSCRSNSTRSSRRKRRLRSKRRARLRWPANLRRFHN